jgi:Ca-activated chloride channel family protein
MMQDDDDDFARLAKGLRTAPPAPDAAAKAAALARAMENFDRLQETATAVRPNPDRPKGAGFWTGISTMLSTLTSRGALTATASVAALALGIVVTGHVARTPSGPALNLPGTQAPVLPATGADTRARQPEAATAAPAPADPLAATAGSVASVAAADPAPPAPPPPPALADDGAVVADLAVPEAIVGQDAMAMPVEEAESRTELARPAAPGRAQAKIAEGGEVLGSAAPAPEMDFAAAAEPVPMAGLVAPQAEMAPVPEPDTEAFSNETQNPVKLTAEDPVSTFSIDVDTASYAVVRSSLMSGMLPPPEAVRIEEMVNYFPYAYAAPEPGEAPFKAQVTVMPAPWNDGRQLVQIGLQGRLPALADRPPLNLVFLIDTSGSMEDQNKLPLLKQSLRLMLGQLRPEDQVAMVVYAGSAGEVLPPTPASDTAAILGALDRLAAGGSTAGAEGLELAYQVAERMAGDGEVSRILLATDGDFNVGLSDPEGLEAYIAKKRETGTYLSVLGFGRGNLDDATMQALAQAGNGTAAYIDTLQEARKVLVDQLTGALFPIADDVKIQVEWNPATVAEWRLIGYETRALAREDFNNDRVDAGEIGAGHAVTAIYEITAPDSPARAVDALRYGEAAAAGPDGELGFLRLRYKDPGQDISKLLEVPITPGMGEVGTEAKFAAAIAGFGQLLNGAKYLGDWGWEDAIALALEGRGEDAFGYRTEAVSLMRLAQGLSGQ